MLYRIVFCICPFTLLYPVFFLHQAVFFASFPVHKSENIDNTYNNQGLALFKADLVSGKLIMGDERWLKVRKIQHSMIMFYDTDRWAF